MDECKKLGQRIAVHATELETAKRAAKYGANILVHSVFNEKIDQEFIDLLLENNVIYIPTLMVRNGYRDVFRTRLFLTDFEQRWGDPAVISSFEQLITIDADQIPEDYRNLRDEWSQDPVLTTEFPYYNLKQLVDAGVQIATGTDAGNVGTLHGPSLHTEMQHMIDAGMSPAEVLIATTKNAASVLGIDNVGTIKEGKQADLVLLSANPLEAIQNATKIELVIRNGNIFQPKELISTFNPVHLIDQQVKAYNSRNIDEFLSYYHPRIQIFDMQSGKLRMNGLEEMRARYQNLFESSPNLKATIVNRISLGSMVIDHEKIEGRKDGTIHAIAYYEVKHQKIVRVWFSR